MPYTRTTRALIPLLCLLWAGTISAADASPTLAEAVRASLQRHPELPLADAMHGQGTAARRQASSLLAAEPAIRLRHEGDDASGGDGYRLWEGGLEMPLWLPGQRQRRLQVADATDEEADATRRLQQWRVAGEVRELLWALRIADDELALAQQATHSGKALEADVARRVQAGELAHTDLILARKEALAREVAELGALSTRDTLLEQFRAMTGLSDYPRAIDEAPAALSAIPDSHPALQAARLAGARARAQREQVRTEKRGNPVLMLGSRSERPESGLSYDTALTLEVNLPLGSAAHAAPAAAQADRALVEAEAAAARMRRELETAFIRATAQKQRSLQELQLAERQQQLAAQGLRLTQRAFELGESDLFTLLQARAQALESERALRIRRLDVGRAHATYNQALGVIPE